jgi:N-acetylmuramoyl-L-alanine amidase
MTTQCRGHYSPMQAPTFAASQGLVNHRGLGSHYDLHKNALTILFKYPISMIYKSKLEYFLSTNTKLLAALLLLLFWSHAAWATKQATATAIEVVSRGETTQFSAVLTAETGFSAQVLAEPYRVIIDMSNVSFDLPPGAGRNAAGLIRQVRYGIIEKGKSRIVIDTVGPVLIKQSQLLPRKGKSKPRITIDLIETTAEDFTATLKRDEALAKAEATGNATASLPIIMPKVIPVDAPKKRDGRRLIVIDPGHGGVDPGAVSRNRTKEKDVVFDFARDLQTALLADGKHDVLLTRDNDRFMSLTDRVAFTRRNQADLFIAVHADILRGQTVSGTTLYTLSDTASDEEAAALALKENRADIIAGVDLGEQIVEVADILIDLVQRESKNHANLFSSQALIELKGVTTMTGQPLRSAGFVVLKAPDVPSILMELGYLSSAEDEKKLKNPKWRKAMAGAMVSAINKHFATMDAAE